MRFLVSTYIKEHSAIILLVGLAGFLRVFYLDWGLPNLYQHDGINFVENALRIGKGKLEPDQLMHGTFLPLILFFEHGMLYLLGRIWGFFCSTSDFILWYLRDPSMFFLLGRGTVALLGTGSIFLTYLIGKRFFNKKVGIIASVFVAFSVTHFIFSTMIKADIPATFFTLLSFYFLTKAFLENDLNNRKIMWSYWMAGFVLGLAIATKLTALPGIIPFCLTYFLIQSGSLRNTKAYFLLLWNKKFLMGLVFLFLGFFIAEPYAILNFKKFLLGLICMKADYIDYATVKYPQIFYFTNHLNNSIGLLLTILFCISVFYYIFKPSKKVILAFSFPVAHYLCFNSFACFANHLLPTIPFIAIISAVFINDVVSRLNYKRLKNPILIFLTIILALPSGLNCLRYLYVLSKDDTRTVAKSWIEENIPCNTPILIEGAVHNLLTMTPQLRGNLHTLEEDLGWVASRSGSGYLQKLLIAKFDNSQKSYRLYKTMVLKEEDIERFNADYVITSGFLDEPRGFGTRDREYYRSRARMYQKLKEKYDLVKKIEPFPRFRYYFPLFTSLDFKELKRISFFNSAQNVIPGPEIKIYKRK